MNNQIERLDKRIKQLVTVSDKELRHIRNKFTNTLRNYQGDRYDIDLRLADTPKRVKYMYMIGLEFSACGFNFIIDIVID